MIDHVSLGTHHYAQAVAFYRAALAPLGFELLRDTGKEAAFGTPDRWTFFLYPASEDEPAVARGAHLAFSALSRSQVQAVHAAALQNTAQDIFSPRERPDISPTYFGAMFHDLDGHRIEVVTNVS